MSCATAARCLWAFGFIALPASSAASGYGNSRRRDVSDLQMTAPAPLEANPVFARAGNPPPPRKPGPFRIVANAMARLRGRIDDLTRRADEIDASRRGYFKRLDVIEARLRDMDKRAAPPAQVKQVF